MKLLPIMTAIGLGILSLSANAANNTNKPATTMPNAVPAQVAGQEQGLVNTKDKLSYAIGFDIGQGFKGQGIDVDPQIIMRGMKDALLGAQSAMSIDQVHAILIEFQKQLIAKRDADFKQASQKNAQESKAFLAANKAKPGVVTLANGLQYKVLKGGTGPIPSAQDMVTVNYSGSFINGKVFDSSYQRGKPVTFPVTEVIPGWTQALKLMKVGSSWEIYVPAELAYGSNGMPPVIGPNQALIFKIELLSVNKKA